MTGKTNASCANSKGIIVGSFDANGYPLSAALKGFNIVRPEMFSNLSASSGAWIKMTSITSDIDVPTISVSGFANCEHLETVTIKGITTLRKLAFGGCSCLTSIDLSQANVIEGLSGQGAFHACDSLQSVVIGSVGHPVTSIGSYAFMNCGALTSITVYTTGGAALSNASTKFGATNATVTFLSA